VLRESFSAILQDQAPPATAYTWWVWLLYDTSSGELLPDYCCPPFPPCDPLERREAFHRILSDWLDDTGAPIAEHLRMYHIGEFLDFYTVGTEGEAGEGSGGVSGGVSGESS